MKILLYILYIYIFTTELNRYTNNLREKLYRKYCHASNIELFLLYIILKSNIRKTMASNIFLF